MNPLLIVIVFLFIIIIFLLIRLLIIKSNLRSFTRELEKTSENGYDRFLRLTLGDRDMERLAAQLNKNLEYQKNMKLEEERERQRMEQSVSDIAHDLRTPLTVIRGNLRMLSEEKLSEKGREYLKAAEGRAEVLKNMVDEFFELSLIESGDLSIEKEKIDLTAFLAQFLVDNESMIRARGLEPDVRLPEKSIIINSDRGMLTRVMSNLLNNVCKYAKGSFMLSAAENGDGAEIVLENRIMEDAGIDTEHIFDRTYRADKARRDGSAGLGLYIVKLLVEKMDGSIEALAEDGRLKFRITL
ncbi:MAG: HAMP domain-containing histidine kinase [Lachnospiraceae bacterium]|nr:HAMP domain-containing histidine kinase [Lachnospiraceae bacterium]